MTKRSLPHAGFAWRVQMWRAALLAVLLVGCAPAWGTPAGATLTAEQEATARRVEEQLMAPCCFGSTVATHHSPAADAIRDDVRSLVAQGANEQEILDLYLDRYGDCAKAVSQMLSVQRDQHLGGLQLAIHPAARQGVCRCLHRLREGVPPACGTPCRVQGVC